jgi:hypothetical protein
VLRWWRLVGEFEIFLISISYTPARLPYVLNWKHQGRKAQFSAHLEASDIMFRASSQTRETRPALMATLHNLFLHCMSDVPGGPLDSGVRGGRPSPLLRAGPGTIAHNFQYLELFTRPFTVGAGFRAMSKRLIIYEFYEYYCELSPRVLVFRSHFKALDSW